MKDGCWVFISTSHSFFNGEVYYSYVLNYIKQTCWLCFHMGHFSTKGFIEITHIQTFNLHQARVEQVPPNQFSSNCYSQISTNALVLLFILKSKQTLFFLFSVVFFLFLFSSNLNKSSPNPLFLFSTKPLSKTITQQMFFKTLFLQALFQNLTQQIPPPISPSLTSN